MNLKKKSTSDFPSFHLSKTNLVLILERDTRIELASFAWEANVLPLYESRVYYNLSVFPPIFNGFDCLRSLFPLES